MALVSKLLGEAGANTGIEHRGASILRLLCTLSSSTSAIILLKLYRKSLKIRKSTKKALQVQRLQSLQKSQDGVEQNRRHGVNTNKKLYSQFMRIFRILVPKWNSPEVGFMSLISFMLVVRSCCDLWTIYLGTLLEAAIISGETSSFLQHLKKFALTMPLMSLTNSLLKYSSRQLEIRFRARLTKHLMQKYMYKMTFYKLNQKMRNTDALITTDVERFASTSATLYSQLSKPMLDILIYVYGISRSIGASVPATMLGYLAVAAFVIAILRRPMARLTASEQALEGEYRFANSRIITNSEEISFYKGGPRELEWMLNSFSNLYQHLDGFIAFKFITEFFENFVAKYIATVVGYYAVGRPFFNVKDGTKFTQKEFKTRQESYYRSGRMLVNLSQAIGRLTLNAKNLSRLAGYTSRIHELLDNLNRLNLEEDNRLENQGTNKSLGRYVIQDHVIRFENVPIVTPNGDVLIKCLCLEVRSGMNVLVTGPNGCGKSSLFRILGELWPLTGGTLTKPDTSKLFYVPQKPYMPYGSFRDQIIYPDSVSEMRAKGLRYGDLVKFLQLVDLDWMVIQSADVPKKPSMASSNDNHADDLEQIWRAEGGEGEIKEQELRTLGQRRSWDAIENWMDVLSGGQKQRLAMARMIYHRPQYAILDECTSAVSVDIEGSIYRYCRSANITLFTVTHRKSLYNYHDYVLHMDGRGSYSMKKIDHDKDPEFGS
ncbi:ATP-binding cassette sub-family D member 3 [Folsomia candida]|uniref:ATP-binding cassette sub-family D member 3 n=1 Tax=Folsomia candida TaxID=158441 RepID=UPI000B905BA5|nr:ATP-binding cassette sub-family D member 3 [Folsomia candida]